MSHLNYLSKRAQIEIEQNHADFYIYYSQWEENINTAVFLGKLEELLRVEDFISKVLVLYPLEIMRN